MLQQLYLSYMAKIAQIVINFVLVRQHECLMITIIVVRNKAKRPGWIIRHKVITPQFEQAIGDIRFINDDTDVSGNIVSQVLDFLFNFSITVEKLKRG